MQGRSIPTDSSTPAHLKDKYHVYALRFENNSLIKVHVGRPISFKTFCETYVLRHAELMSHATKTLFLVSAIAGIEKIPNSNKPDFEISAEGLLFEVK